MLNLAIFERMPWSQRPSSCWCYLGNAYVLPQYRNTAIPQYRNQGVGSALLNAAVNHALKLGAARIVLSRSNRSVPFYQRSGFGSATMLMALDLT
jgi:GNAT superfamily N-acetyltransferase